MQLFKVSSKYFCSCIEFKIGDLFELNVKSSDLGFIYVGQSVDIRLDAFAFTKYGSIIGKVAYIDPNSISNEKGQLFYRIKAEMVENNIRVDGLSK